LSSEPIELKQNSHFAFFNEIWTFQRFLARLDDDISMTYFGAQRVRENDVVADADGGVACDTAAGW